MMPGDIAANNTQNMKLLLNAVLKKEVYEVSPFEEDLFIGPKNQVIRQIVPSPAKLIIVSPELSQKSCLHVG